MGAVHGVYLKYVGLSAMSYAGYAALMNAAPNMQGSTSTTRTLVSEAGTSMFDVIPALVLGYSAILNGAIALLIQLRFGMAMMGKHKEKGTIPLWSYLLFFPFHIPTIMYTYIHTRTGKYKDPKDGSKLPVPVASEVLPGWWLGGRYSHRLNKKFAAIVDLTVEFPELCPADSYLLIPVWDGVPPNPAQLEEAATFCAEAHSRGGDVLIHCAHGRGRSTTMMCAALVKAGLYKDWLEAFDAIKKGRPVAKLNSKMRKALAAWQGEYVDSRKTQ